MRDAFVDALSGIAARDPRIVLLTADLGFQFLEAFRDRFPTRFYNVGVAEQNMIGLAVGLAEAGLLPFVYSITPFVIARPFEILRTVATERFPVRLVGVGGGFDYATAGATHHGVDDLALARSIPDLDVIIPAEPADVAALLAQTLERPRTVYCRLAKDARSLSLPPAEIGRVRTLRDGSDLTLVTLGPLVEEVLRAADLLAASGVSARVALVSSLAPAPTDDILATCEGSRLVMTVEDHLVVGGLGSWVAELVSERGLGVRVERRGVTDRAVRSGSRAHLLRAHRLDARAVAESAREALR